MGKKTDSTKTLTEIVHRYNSDPTRRKFKPENFLEIPRLFGRTAAIDMNRLVCQHQQHVASAYMRRIRKDKIQQRDVYFKKLQSIPMKIKRMAVGPDYTDPYTSLKHRLPKLGQDQDNKIGKSHTPPYPHMENSNYVSHNGLTPNLNILFKMNPVGVDINNNKTPHLTGTHTPAHLPNTNNNNNSNTTTTNNKGNHNNINHHHNHNNKKSDEQLPFSLSPRRIKPLRLQNQYKPEPLPKIKKRLSIDPTDATTTAFNPIDLGFASTDTTPRCPTNSPRNAFWNFNVPKELKNGARKSHISSIPRGNAGATEGKDVLSAINSVQKHNKPLPMIMSKA